MDISYKRSPLQKTARVRVKRDKTQKYCDGFGVVHHKPSFVRVTDIAKSRLHNTYSLSARGVRTSFFVTEDSWRYISPWQMAQSQRGHAMHDRRLAMDSLSARYTTTTTRGATDYIEVRVHAEFARLQNRLFALRKMRMWNLSPLRMWQFSMVGAMLFGMITMSAIYKNLGQSVSASHDAQHRAFTRDPMTALILEGGTQAITEEKPAVATDEENRIGRLPLQEEKLPEDPEQRAFEERAREMVAGYPIEKMLPYIFTQDREVAMYIIAIAKQESAWGKRVPVLNGQDCYNYWGYRAQRARMGSGGHTCFDSHQDAVETVGKRIYSLIYDYGRTEPTDLLIWKCGRSCAGHPPEGVARWVNTVTMYRNALMRTEKE